MIKMQKFLSKDFNTILTDSFGQLVMICGEIYVGGKDDAQYSISDLFQI